VSALTRRRNQSAHHELLDRRAADVSAARIFQETDTGNLFGENIDADHLNDHRLGRALDSLSAAEPSTVLETVLLKAASREDLSTEVVHADTTSVSIQSHYDPDEDDTTDESLSITHGFSKGNRPDLKQFNIGLGVNQTGVPVFGQILDGNASDKTWNTDLIGELRQWLDTDELPVYVADSAAVTEATLDKAAEHGVDLISRLPATYSAVDELSTARARTMTGLTLERFPTTMTPQNTRTRLSNVRSTTTNFGVSSFTPHLWPSKPASESMITSTTLKTTSKTRSPNWTTTSSPANPTQRLLSTSSSTTTTRTASTLRPT
jgi:transposase